MKCCRDVKVILLQGSSSPSSPDSLKRKTSLSENKADDVDLPKPKAKRRRKTAEEKALEQAAKVFFYVDTENFVEIVLRNLKRRKRKKKLSGKRRNSRLER